MRSLKRPFALFALCLLLLALFAQPSFADGGGELYQISAAELEAIAQNADVMMRSVAELQQFVAEQNQLLQKQQALTAQYKTSWQKSERASSRWKLASQIEGALLVGFAGGAIAWHCLR